MELLAQLQPYLFPVLCLAGLVVVAFRYRSTAVFGYGTASFVLLLACAALAWLFRAIQSPSLAMGTVIDLTWAAGLGCMLAAVLRLTRPEQGVVAGAIVLTVMVVALAAAAVGAALGGWQAVVQALFIWLVVSAIAVIAAFTQGRVQPGERVMTILGAIGLYPIVLGCYGVYYMAQKAGSRSVLLVLVGVFALFATASSAFAVAKRFRLSAPSLAGSFGFGLLSLIGATALVVAMGQGLGWIDADLAVPSLAVAWQVAPGVAWLAIVVFFATAASHPAAKLAEAALSRPFVMDETRWGGVVAMVTGALICGWQLYEVSTGDHLTVWIIGFIPVPVILLGSAGVVGGLIALLKG